MHFHKIAYIPWFYDAELWEWLRAGPHSYRREYLFLCPYTKLYQFSTKNHQEKLQKWLVAAFLHTPLIQRWDWCQTPPQCRPDLPGPGLLGQWGRMLLILVFVKFRTKQPLQYINWHKISKSATLKLSFFWFSKSKQKWTKWHNIRQSLSPKI